VPPQTESLGSQQIETPLIAIHNNYWLQAKVNHAAPVNFVLDTGASIVQIPEETAAALVRAGMLTSADVRGYATTVLADGRTGRRQSSYCTRSMSAVTSFVTFGP